jgi:hypothetical protein
MQTGNVRKAETHGVSTRYTDHGLTAPPIRDEITQVRELEQCPAGGHSEALQVHNTTSTAQLFIRAAFAGLPPSFRRGDQADSWTPALFCLGGIDAAGELGRLSQRARARIERVFLRDRFGLGRIASWRLQHALHQRALTPMGQEVQSAGRRALVEWLRGDDPSWRLQQLLRLHPDRAPRVRHHGRRSPQPQPTLH